MMLDTGAAAVAATTPGGAWLVAAVMWPVVAVLLAIVAGGRYAARMTLAAMPVGLAVAWVIAMRVWEGGAITYLVGGWAPPLGIALRADGLSAAMMLTTAIVITGAGLFAHADFAPKPGEPETRGSLVFWTLLIAVWGAMNLVVMGRDLFNLYVALELLTFAAVPLVCLDGRAATLAAALRYLMFALLGLGAVPARRRAALRRLRHARHHSAGGARAARAGGLGRRRADDRGPARQDRAVPAAPVAAAGPRRRPAGRQRRALGAGGEGLVRSCSCACGSK